MKIEQEIQVTAAIGYVWAFFEDVPRVATCMPGAVLTEVVDPNTFDGMVAVKVGPIGVNYQGRLIIEERDLATHTVRMKAQGKDRKGAGSASAKIVATLIETAPGSTRLFVSSDVQLSGRIATLGRGVQDVAGKIFEDFGNRMSAEIGIGPVIPAADELAPTGTTTTYDDLAGSGLAHKISTPSRGSATPDRALPAIPVPARAPIKAGALFWSICRDKFRQLLARRRNRS